jgi:hypothetical protein
MLTPPSGTPQGRLLNDDRLGRALEALALVASKPAAG